MANSKKKAFTLIELIAVLVIMAIIALIATPLVMNIIRKARTASDKRSIDAYGRSIELAIAGYLLDTGSFPTEVSQLTIEYSGNEVVCSTTQLNSDSSVYLDGCTVDGRSVEYHYGENKNTTPEPVTPSYTAYSVGDHVSYNGVTYYVIEDSDTTNNTVKLLKENPLTKTEMDNLNLTGITISENNGYGRVLYGTTTDYATSIVKQVVDAWKNTAVKSGDTATSRLITYTEIDNNFEFEEFDPCGGCGAKAERLSTPWMYNSKWKYWTMSSYDDSESKVWKVDSNGIVNSHSVDGGVYNEPLSIRPVLELNKSAEITKLN